MARARRRVTTLAEGEEGEEAGVEEGGGGGQASSTAGIRNELLAILNELRFITKKMKDDTERSDETNDWKFAAMVIDRLCFWIFSAYLVIATMIIFISPQYDYINRPLLDAAAAADVQALPRTPWVLAIDLP